MLTEWKDVILRFEGTRETFTETVAADQQDLAPDLWQLKAHSTFAPLAPGDIVTVDDLNAVVDVKHLESLWTVEATLHLPAGVTFGMETTAEHPAAAKVTELEEGWRRAAYVTRCTSFSFLVSAQTRGWIEDNVEAHPYVEHIELIRTPDMRADLDYWLSHPNGL